MTQEEFSLLFHRAKVNYVAFKMLYEPEAFEAMHRMVEMAIAEERERVSAWMIQRSYATGHGDTTEDLLKELDWQIDERIAYERMNTNNAYKERNQLVALLSILFPSGKAKTAIEGWDEAWHGCVYIDFPWGQASWHYHTDDELMFSHLPPYTKEWDGHTTEAKYAAIASAIRARGNK